MLSEKTPRLNSSEFLELLTKAKELLRDKNSWIKGSLYRFELVQCQSTKIGYCFRGALDTAQEELRKTHGDQNNSRYQMNWKLLVEGINPGDDVAPMASLWNQIAEWNDNPQRTHQEILEAFDRCIKICKSSGE